MLKVFFSLFMGNSPKWYKILIISFLVLNPILLLFFSKFIIGWLILSEFIITLALAIKCYPLLPGGLIAIQCCFIGMMSSDSVYNEVKHNINIILLLMFMVAGIYFMKDFLTWVFRKILFSTKSKIILSLMFSFMGAFLSAWLDALTVIAVIIAVCTSFYEIYNEVSYEERVPDLIIENKESIVDINKYINEKRYEIGKKDLNDFKGFLRNLLMHAAIGTALGGVSTIVGEPQNLLIGQLMNWSFKDFFFIMSHISIPVFISGLLTLVFLEKFKIFGYGYALPDRVFNVLKKIDTRNKKNMDKNDYLIIFFQGVGAIWLIIALAFHLAEVGLIGLSVIILLTTLTGRNNEHDIGKAFEEAMPFTSLLVIFFAIVAMIQENNLFAPIIKMAFSFEGTQQIYAFFFASGLLSAISDNVFVATIYIQEVIKAFENNLIDQNQLNLLAIAINVGTNIPSIATPNGQAAFLFLLTSSIASKIKLSYMTMVKMTIPYTIVLIIVSSFFLSFDWVKYDIPNVTKKKTQIEGAETKSH